MLIGVMWSFLPEQGNYLGSAVRQQTSCTKKIVIGSLNNLHATTSMFFWLTNILAALHSLACGCAYLPEGHRDSDLIRKEARSLLMRDYPRVQFSYTDMQDGLRVVYELDSFLKGNRSLPN